MNYLVITLLLAISLIFQSLSMAQAEEAQICPKVSFLGDAVSLTQFSSVEGKPSPKNIQFKARLKDYEGGCDYDTNKVTVDMDLNIVAERGPALHGDEAKYQYFVAVLDPQKNILAKQEFNTLITFPKGKQTAGTKETLTPTIPLPAGAHGEDYTILIGFQLTEDQLAYNRAMQGK